MDTSSPAESPEYDGMAEALKELFDKRTAETANAAVAWPAPPSLMLMEALRKRGLTVVAIDAAATAGEDRKPEDRKPPSPDQGKFEHWATALQVGDPTDGAEALQEFAEYVVGKLAAGHVR